MKRVEFSSAKGSPRGENQESTAIFASHARARAFNRVVCFSAYFTILFLHGLVYDVQLLAQPPENERERGGTDGEEETTASSELLQLPVMLNESIGNIAAEAVTRPAYVTALQCVHLSEVQILRIVLDRLSRYLEII